MSEEKVNDDLSKWFSSYGLMTAERILEQYSIQLDPDDLIASTKNPHSFFHPLLRVPVKNVLNGIVLDQAKSYHLFLQKLMIDFLMSGETTKPEGSSGSQSREDLGEEHRLAVQLGDDFNKQEKEHRLLIAESQAALIDFCTKWRMTMQTLIESILAQFNSSSASMNAPDIERAVYSALAHESQDLATVASQPSNLVKKISEALGLPEDHSSLNELAVQCRSFLDKSQSITDVTEPFIQRAQAMSEGLRYYRSQFYDHIIRVNELLSNLSDYSLDIEKLQVNKESLVFDKDLG